MYSKQNSEFLLRGILQLGQLKGDSAAFSEKPVALSSPAMNHGRSKAEIRREQHRLENNIPDRSRPQSLDKDREAFEESLLQYMISRTPDHRLFC